MIIRGVVLCPGCGGVLKRYDKVPRIVRTKGRAAYRMELVRMKCTLCGHVHRENPDDLFPYKHYESEIILGVLEQTITPDVLGYEDYPCETTMLRWMTQKTQLLLWKNL